MTEAQDEAVHVAKVSAMMEAGVSFALNSSLLAVLAVGGQQVLDSTLSWSTVTGAIPTLHPHPLALALPRCSTVR